MIISAAGVKAGYTVTSQPRSARERAILALAPKSRSATLKPAPFNALTRVGLGSRTPFSYASLSKRAEPDSGPFSSRLTEGFTTYFSLQVTFSTTFPVV